MFGENISFPLIFAYAPRADPFFLLFFLFSSVSSSFVLFFFNCLSFLPLFICLTHRIFALEKSFAKHPCFQLMLLVNGSNNLIVTMTKSSYLFASTGNN